MKYMWWEKELTQTGIYLVRLLVVGETGYGSLK